MEIKKEVKPIQIQYECPECKKGHIFYTGYRLASGNIHKCNNDECGYEMAVKEKEYPYIEWEEISK